MQLNPSAANALQACSVFDFGPLSGPEGAPGTHLLEGSEEEAQTGNEHFSAGPPDCPDASKLGTVAIQTPLLEREVTGSLYLAAQNTSPFRSPLAMYLRRGRPDGRDPRQARRGSEDRRGRPGLDHVSQHPAAAVHAPGAAHLRRPARLALDPAHCGPATSTSEFVPWSGRLGADPESSFQNTAGAGRRAMPRQPAAVLPVVQGRADHPCRRARSPRSSWTSATPTATSP